MDEVESLFTQHFANSDRKKAMKFLRPQQNKESHMVTFFVGNSSLTTHPPTPLYIKIETKHKKFKYPSLYVSLDPSICTYYTIMLTKGSDKSLTILTKIGNWMSNNNNGVRGGICRSYPYLVHVKRLFRKTFGSRENWMSNVFI